MDANEPAGGASSKKIVIAVIAGAILIPVLASSYLIYSRLIAREQPQFEAVADYFEAPQTIPERVGAVSTHFVSLEVSRGGLEVFDETGKHHSITPNGEWLQRGEPLPPSETFTLEQLDFAVLPVVLAAAATDGGRTPNSVTAGVIEGELRWRARIIDGATTKDLIYALDGTLVSGG